MCRRGPGVGGPFEATYAASKAFLLSFSEALHNELKDHGITVTALMRGKDHVVTGARRNKVMAAMAKVTPEATKARLHRVLSRPGSGR